MNMTSKTKKILTWVVTALVLAAAVIAVVVEVSPTTDPEVVLQDSTVVEVVDTVAPVVMDSVPVDSVVAE